MDGGRSVTTVNDSLDPAPPVHHEAPAWATGVGAGYNDCDVIALVDLAFRFSIPDECHRRGASLSQDHNMVTGEISSPDFGMLERLRDEKEICAAQWLGRFDRPAVDDMGVVGLGRGERVT